MPDDLRWEPINALPDLNGSVGPILESADTMQHAWADWLNYASPEEFEEARRRSLRRHAIETGVIERLYDVDWGVTEALVAEGITGEAAAHAGEINDHTLATIRTQFDALSFLTDTARAGRDLSVHFVRELHQAITRHQRWYDRTDTFGRPTRRVLKHGTWKQLPNRVTRPDGSVLEYAPPEHVESEMDRLVELYRAAEDAHPLVRAAWLHHRFIRIHPFEDGNGRVARARGRRSRIPDRTARRRVPHDADGLPPFTV